MQETMMIKAGFAAIAAAALATPAMATTPTDPFVQPSATLSLEGLDLASVEGQRRLAIRMDDAARAVCGDGLDTVHLHAHARAQECRVAVLDQIRDQIETRMAAKTAPVRLAANR
ncbi:UrcA family protein [Qipengyuania flava]